MRTDQEIQQKIFLQLLRTLIYSAKIASGCRIIEDTDKSFIDIVKKSSIYKIQFPEIGLLKPITDEIKNPEYSNVFMILNSTDNEKSKYVARTFSKDFDLVDFKSNIEQNFYNGFIFITLWENKEVNDEIAQLVTKIYSDYISKNFIGNTGQVFPQFIFINENADN